MSRKDSVGNVIPREVFEFWTYYEILIAQTRIPSRESVTVSLFNGMSTFVGYLMPMLFS